MVLVELFAWMSEMVIFRLNQVPDVFYTRMLDLLGVQPYPPSAARTVVTFVLAPGMAEEVVVAAGTQVATAGREPVVFATTAELVVRQPTVVAAVTVPTDGAAVRVWNRLLAGDDSVALFGDPPTPGDSFLVGFAGSLAGALLELQLDLVPPPGIAADPRCPSGRRGSARAGRRRWSSTTRRIGSCDRVSCGCSCRARTSRSTSGRAGVLAPAAVAAPPSRRVAVAARPAAHLPPGHGGWRRRRGGALAGDAGRGARDQRRAARPTLRHPHGAGAGAGRW